MTKQTSLSYLFLLIMIPAAIVAYYFDSQKNAEIKNKEYIVEYESCLVRSSNTTEINGVDVEITKANIIAICVYKNDGYRKTDHYKINKPSIQAQVCPNRKPFNQDVVLHGEVTEQLLRLAREEIHESNYFFTMYNMNQRAAYWKENYRVGGERIIC